MLVPASLEVSRLKGSEFRIYTCHVCRFCGKEEDDDALGNFQLPKILIQHANSLLQKDRLCEKARPLGKVVRPVFLLLPALKIFERQIGLTGIL